jgi:Uma2 family endonuclease
MTSLLVNNAVTTLPIDLSALISQMTAVEFYAFCRTNPSLRIERNADGTIVIMSPAFADTGNRNIKIAAQIENWSEADGTGEAFDSSAGFTLPNGATRSPDAAWIQGDRWNALTPEQQASFAPITPDFVVELRSSSDSLKSLQEKLEEYIANGVRLGLLIDRKHHAVYLYRPGQETIVLENPVVVSCAPEMPGLGLKMAKIW